MKTELSELIGRLRDSENCDVLDDVDEAADELERLAKENEALKQEIGLLKFPLTLCEKIGGFTIVGADLEDETIVLQKTERFERELAERYGKQEDET